MGFFDGFFGLTNNGKAAQNSINGLTQDFQKQMQQWLQQSQQFGNNANGLFDWSRGYWGDRANDGAPSIGAIRQNGESILPFADVLGRMWGRQQNINNDWGNVAKAWDIMPMLQNNLDLQTQNVNNNSDYTQGQINDTFNGLGQRETDATGDIRGRIGGSYDNARDIIAGGYGGARKANQDTYGDILSRTGNAFRDMRSEIEKLKPGGAFQQAQTARSFAPAMAAASGRLRRAGIDPNSMQAANVLGNVEADRARAQDDAAARGTSNYVSAANSLRAGELGATTNALTNRLNNDMNLGTTEAGMQGNLALGRGRDLNNEVVRNLASMNGYDIGRFNANTANSQNTTNRLNDIIRARSNADLLGREMQMQDFNQGAQNQRDMNNLDMTGLNLLDQQWNRGQGYSAWDQNTRDNAANQMMQLMNGQYGNMFNANQAGQSWGNQAMQNLQQLYQQELAKSGWGTRLLGGLAGAAIGGLTGGAGAGGIMSLFGGGKKPATPGFNMSNSSLTGTPAIYNTGSNGFGLFNNPFGNMRMP